MDSKDNKLIVSGDFDPVEVVNKLRKSCNADVVSVESAKKDEGKKNEDQVANLEAYQTYSPIPVTYYYVPCYETPNCVICWNCLCFLTNSGLGLCTGEDWIRSIMPYEHKNKWSTFSRILGMENPFCAPFQQKIVYTDWNIIFLLNYNIFEKSMTRY